MYQNADKVISIIRKEFENENSSTLSILILLIINIDRFTLCR